jgi:biotin operon repressor
VVQGDPVDEYSRAVRRLLELADDVAREQSQEEVLQALGEVRAAVTRAYPRRRAEGGTGGARTRILRFLLSRLGEWVSSEEIAAIAGIDAWTRRIRELRFEQGYEIEEGGGRYRILAEEPNLARRDRWQTVTTIRNREGEAVERVQELFETLVGETLTLDEINRVAHGKDGARLARQLRNQQLLPVETSADAPDLRAGEHRLVSLHEWDRLHPTQALFPEDLRRQVFSRDRFVCRVCRVSRTTPGNVDDGVFFLVVRHLDASSDAVPALPAERVTELARLATWCNRCAAAGGA